MSKDTFFSVVSGAVGAAILCILTTGCAPPEVRLSHVLPAALPAPQAAAAWRVKEITFAEPGSTEKAGADHASVQAVPITPDLAKSMEAHLRKALGERLAMSASSAARKPASGECLVDATIHAAIGDTRGTRDVLQVDPATQLTTSRELATLIRRARMRVEFDVTYVGHEPGGKSRHLGAVEVSRTYNSAVDPVVRGKLGLERPDDPNRVPPADTILVGLLDQCARAFERMTSSTPLSATVRLRPAAGPNAEKALAAARREDWHAAVDEFGKALADRPGDAALEFDLAVACEAGGMLDQAEKHYQRALDASSEKDTGAYDGVRRCRRVIEADKAVSPLAANGR